MQVIHVPALVQRKTFKKLSIYQNVSKQPYVVWSCFRVFFPQRPTPLQFLLTRGICWFPWRNWLTQAKLKGLRVLLTQASYDTTPSTHIKGGFGRWLGDGSWIIAIRKIRGICLVCLILVGIKRKRHLPPKKLRITKHYEATYDWRVTHGHSICKS